MFHNLNRSYKALHQILPRCDNALFSTATESLQPSQVVKKLLKDKSKVVERDGEYFRQVLATRKKMRLLGTPHPRPYVTREVDESTQQQWQEKALVANEKESKKESRRKNARIASYRDLDYMIEHSKKILVENPSMALQNYINACRIASMLRLDPINDAELIELKKRLQYICYKHRLDVVPPIEFFERKGFVACCLFAYFLLSLLNIFAEISGNFAQIVNRGCREYTVCLYNTPNRYMDVLQTCRKYGNFSHVVSLVGLKGLAYLPNSKHPCAIPPVSAVSPFLSPYQQRQEWIKLKNECLKYDILRFMKKKKYLWLPPRSLLIKLKRYDLERRILKLGGHEQASKILKIPYKPKRPLKYFDNLANVVKELECYYEKTGANPFYIPNRLELIATGFNDLSKKIKTLKQNYNAENEFSTIVKLKNKHYIPNFVDTENGKENANANENGNGNEYDEKGRIINRRKGIIKKEMKYDSMTLEKALTKLARYYKRTELDVKEKQGRKLSSRERSGKRGTDHWFKERPSNYLPNFALLAKKYENVSRLLQELFLIMNNRDTTVIHYYLTLPEIIDVHKRYDVGYAILKYHGGYKNSKHLFPKAIKPMNYYDDCDNVAKEMKSVMKLLGITRVMPHPYKLIASGHGFVAQCVEELHGGFIKFAEYIHTPCFFTNRIANGSFGAPNASDDIKDELKDEIEASLMLRLSDDDCISHYHSNPLIYKYTIQNSNNFKYLDEKFAPKYWDDTTNIKDELMTFICDMNINYIPSKLELISAANIQLWQAMSVLALKCFVKQLIDTCIEYQKVVNRDPETYSNASNASKTTRNPLKLSDLQFKFEKQFCKHLGNIGDSHKVMNDFYFNFNFKENNIKPIYNIDKFENTKFLNYLKILNLNEIKLSEIEIMKIISHFYKIPIDKNTYLGGCAFVKTAENEWKDDYNGFCKEIFSFNSWYKECCFVIDKSNIHKFSMPYLEDIAYSKRFDINYAILSFYGGHKRLAKRISKMSIDDLRHPFYGQGKNKDELLMLEHGSSIWQYKALPGPPLHAISDVKLLGDNIEKEKLIESGINEEKIDTMFLPEATGAGEFADPTKQLLKDRGLHKRLRHKNKTLIIADSGTINKVKQSKKANDS